MYDNTATERFQPSNQQDHEVRQVNDSIQQTLQVFNVPS